MERTEKSFTDKFWNLVKIVDGKCWKWVGAKAKKGYGFINHKGKKYLAHRVVWQLSNGEIEEGMCVCHKCDNPECCNPDHLFLGTPFDNARDRVKKNRSAVRHGIEHSKAKLDEKKVSEIKQLIKKGCRFSEIAEKFSICQSSVYHINSGQNWRHVK